MVIGNGLVANIFKDYSSDEDFIFFASGVSNSLEVREHEYDREFELLERIINENPFSTLVYFSTLSITDRSLAKNPYINHKIKIESFIEKNVKSYYIFRISNIIGNSNNPNTLINFFINSIKFEKTFDIWINSARNVIDQDDVRKMVTYAINNLPVNCIYDVATRLNISVIDIVHEIEAFLNKKANYLIVDKGGTIEVNDSPFTPILDEIENSKGSGLEYLRYLLKTYYVI